MKKLYKAIAQEDWTDFDQTLLDGLEKVHYPFYMISYLAELNPMPWGS